ncbi:MAG: hypothetical protein NT148_02285, partial [Candidatus Nealsonbacteria bacterium]|nr:hypothetical protein [Candidatus Nealsonbacteria bacterium]
WEYGWREKLDLKTKYCYLISVYSTERSKIKPWWNLSQNRLAEDFHLGIATVCRGLRELKKAGLLDVEYDDALNEEGKFIGRDTNKYRLRPLFSQEMIDKQWADLRKEFTEEEVHKAGELAALIEEEHNVEKVKDFIRIMSIYGRDSVEKATKMVARLKADNPCKNFGYIVGILKNWEKEGRVD